MINGHDHSLGSAPKTTIENVGGLRLHWTYLEGEGAAVTVYQAIAKQEDGLRLSLFLKAGTEGELTPDTLLAEPYMLASFKADGRIMLSGTSVFVGPSMLKRHMAAIKHAYQRAYQLMKVAPAMPWSEA